MTRFTLGTKILLLIATTIMAVSFVAMLALTAVASSAINQAIRRDVRATGGVLEELLTERSRTLSSQCLLLIQLPALRLEMEFADLHRSRTACVNICRDLAPPPRWSQTAMAASWHSLVYPHRICRSLRGPRALLRPCLVARAPA